MLKFVDEYRDTDLCLGIAEKIKAISRKKINIMEVCGGHTMAIRKNGIHKLVGDNINLVSGPGCPVCVTSMADIDAAIKLSEIKDVALCTFGDLFYVPGSYFSLSKNKALGADIRVIYSVYDALNFARKDKSKNFIFISIGFETTAPTTAEAVIQADAEGLDNFFILALNKTMPHALRAILEGGNSNINALILPGHVSTITGIGIYKFIVDEFNIPCCISGFEPSDMLTSIYMLTEMCEKNKASLANAYKRVVLDNGNEKARSIMSEVFEESDAEWRGLGLIPLSGLRLKGDYNRFDAANRFGIDIQDERTENNCICGDILRGTKKPKDCPLFEKACTPDNPRGACMVSSEGCCAAWYKYGD